jgi:hypothetical protein
MAKSMGKKGTICGPNNGMRGNGVDEGSSVWNSLLSD